MNLVVEWFGRSNRSQIRAHWNVGVQSSLKHQKLSKSVHGVSRTVLSKLGKQDFLMRMCFFLIDEPYPSTRENVIFSSKNQVFSTLKGSFSMLHGPISIIFGVLESSERIHSSAHESGTDWSDQTTPPQDSQKTSVFFILNVI